MKYKKKLKKVQVLRSLVARWWHPI